MLNFIHGGFSMKNYHALWSVLLVVIILTMLGCSSSDDSSSNPIGNNDDNYVTVNFTEMTAMVKKAAPPVFTAPVAAPADLEDWSGGDYPLLSKVFGEDEPMSLYSNLTNLDEIIDMIEQVLQVDDSGNYLADTTYATITNLSVPTIISDAAADVFEFTSIDLDMLVSFTPPENGQAVYDFGFTLNDSTQTVLTFYSGPSYGQSGTVESFLYYAQASLIDSTVIIKGIFFKDYGDQTSARWVYDIQTTIDTTFSYRMSWYADNFGDSSGLGCIIGGGNKSTEFAMKYRQFRPADSPTFDDYYNFDQMFGPNYSDLGTSISASYDDYTDENSIFTLSDMPTVLLTSPF